jgi:hypothetical protein
MAGFLTWIGLFVILLIGLYVNIFLGIFLVLLWIASEISEMNERSKQKPKQSNELDKPIVV